MPAPGSTSLPRLARGFVFPLCPAQCWCLIPLLSLGYLRACVRISFLPCSVPVPGSTFLLGSPRGLCSYFLFALLTASVCFHFPSSVALGHTFTFSLALPTASARFHSPASVTSGPLFVFPVSRAHWQCQVPLPSLPRLLNRKTDGIHGVPLPLSVNREREDTYRLSLSQLLNSGMGNVCGLSLSGQRESIGTVYSSLNKQRGEGG